MTARKDLLARLTTASRLHQDIEAEGGDVATLTPERIDQALMVFHSLANTCSSAVAMADEKAVAGGDVRDFSIDLANDLETMRVQQHEARRALKVLLLSLKALARKEAA